jgi:antirestriction protein ArdC
MFSPPWFDLHGYETPAGRTDSGTRAAFVCAHLGLSTEPREDHAQYIQSWLKVLRADKRAISTAASKAQQAADYLVKRAGDSTRIAELSEVAA